MTGWKSEVKNSFTFWIHDGCMEHLKHVTKNAFMLFYDDYYYVGFVPFCFVGRFYGIKINISLGLDSVHYLKQQVWTAQHYSTVPPVTVCAYVVFSIYLFT